MNRRVVLVFPVLILVTAAALLFRTWRNGVADANAQEAGNPIAIRDVLAYEPSGDLGGVRVTVGLETGRYKAPIELDVRMGSDLREMFEVADATVRLKDGSFDAGFVSSHQPFHAQTPPKGVDSRLLILTLPEGSCLLDLYLRPRSEKFRSADGLTLLQSDELRQKNLRINVAQEN